MAGGIDWFRWHHGTAGDRKFPLVAKRAGARVGDVIAMWSILLEQASCSDDRGNPGNVDFEAIDLALDMPDGTAQSIHVAMQDRNLIDRGTGRLIAWEKRQPKRERPDDNSTERSRKHRATQRQATPEDDGATPSNADDDTGTPRGEESREEERRHSVPGGTGDADAPPAKTPEELTRIELWAAGKSLLLAQGMPAKQCGTFVGKLVKDYGDAIVVEAVRTTVVAQAADAATYLKATCLHLAGKRARAGPVTEAERLAENERTTAEAARLLGIDLHDTEDTTTCVTAT